MPMYNLIEYSDNYFKTSRSLSRYYKDEPNDNLGNFEPFKSKVKITGNTPNSGNTKFVEIIVLLKYLRNSWKTLEMPLINCEVNLISAWFENFIYQEKLGLILCKPRGLALVFRSHFLQNFLIKFFVL